MVVPLQQRRVPSLLPAIEMQPTRRRHQGSPSHQTAGQNAKAPDQRCWWLEQRVLDRQLASFPPVRLVLNFYSHFVKDKGNNVL